MVQKDEDCCLPEALQRLLRDIQTVRWVDAQTQLASQIRLARARSRRRFAQGNDRQGYEQYHRQNGGEDEGKESAVWHCCSFPPRFNILAHRGGKQLAAATPI